MHIHKYICICIYAYMHMCMHTYICLCVPIMLTYLLLCMYVLLASKKRFYSDNSFNGINLRTELINKKSNALLDIKKFLQTFYCDIFVN